MPCLACQGSGHHQFGWTLAHQNSSVAKFELNLNRSFIYEVTAVQLENRIFENIDFGKPVFLKKWYGMADIGKTLIQTV